MVEPGEECDDGNLDGDDGCHLCFVDRHAFATRVTPQPSYLAGLDEADDLCRVYAVKAGLARPQAFVAWLSDSKHDARDRVELSPGRYVLVDGQVVVKEGPDLLSGALVGPIWLDEYGDEATGGVWTGTKPDGRRVVTEPMPSDPLQFCGDWLLSDPSLTGFIGSSDAVDGTWTLYPDDPMDCADNFRIYCIEGR